MLWNYVFSVYYDLFSVAILNLDNYETSMVLANEKGMVGLISSDISYLDCHCYLNTCKHTRYSVCVDKLIFNQKWWLTETFWIKPGQLHGSESPWRLCQWPTHEGSGKAQRARARAPRRTACSVRLRVLPDWAGGLPRSAVASFVTGGRHTILTSEVEWNFRWNKALSTVPGKCWTNVGYCGYYLSPLKYFSQSKICYSLLHLNGSVTWLD